MRQSSKRLISIGVAALFIVGALVVFVNFVQAEYANVENAKGQVASEEQLLTNEELAVKQVQQLVSNYKNGSNVSVALAVPTGEDLAGALAQIYGLAQNAGINVQGVNIASPSLQPPPSGSLVKPLATITFQITATGSYESLKNFLSGLETNVRIFDLKSLTIAPAGVRDSFTYNLNVATYYQTWQ